MESKTPQGNHDTNSAHKSANAEGGNDACPNPGTVQSTTPAYITEKDSLPMTNLDHDVLEQSQQDNGARHEFSVLVDSRLCGGKNETPALYSPGMSMNGRIKRRKLTWRHIQTYSAILPKFQNRSTRITRILQIASNDPKQERRGTESNNSSRRSQGPHRREVTTELQYVSQQDNCGWFFFFYSERLLQSKPHDTRGWK
ncbi:hypothetical protein VTN96DRAFT_6142 [Rasamsonia emersonii]